MLIISVQRHGSHIGFAKMSPDEILHTFRKCCPEAIINSYQPSKKSVQHFHLNSKFLQAGYTCMDVNLSYLDKYTCITCSRTRCSVLSISRPSGHLMSWLKQSFILWRVLRFIDPNANVQQVAWTFNTSNCWVEVNKTSCLQGGSTIKVETFSSRVSPGLWNFDVCQFKDHAEVVFVREVVLIGI